MKELKIKGIIPPFLNSIAWLHAPHFYSSHSAYEINLGRRESKSCPGKQCKCMLGQLQTGDSSHWANPCLVTKHTTSRPGDACIFAHVELTLCYTVPHIEQEKKYMWWELLVHQWSGTDYKRNRVEPTDAEMPAALPKWTHFPSTWDLSYYIKCKYM